MILFCSTLPTDNIHLCLREWHYFQKGKTKALRVASRFFVNLVAFWFHQGLAFSELWSGITCTSAGIFQRHLAPLNGLWQCLEKHSRGQEWWTALQSQAGSSAEPSVLLCHVPAVLGWCDPVLESLMDRPLPAGHSVLLLYWRPVLLLLVTKLKPDGTSQSEKTFFSSFSARVTHTKC